MTHKQQILQVLEKETAVCKRLFTLIPAGMMDYSPGFGMRTTLELLRYMTWCSGSCIEAYMEEDPELRRGVYCKNEAYGESMMPEEFPARMDEQMNKICGLLTDVSDDELLRKEVVLPWREPMILGEALIETSVKWLTGYKMQLFIYLKLNGVQADTGDCWILTE